MSQPTPEPAARGRFGLFFRSVFWRFFSDLVRMPLWHKGVLAAAIVVCGIGWGNRILHLGAYAPTPSATTTANPNQINAVQTDSTIADSQAPDTPTKPAPWARRVGGSVLLGFVVGWAFRTFLKAMTLVTILVVGTLAFLSYFNVMNVDLTSVQKEYSGASGWVTAQANTLKKDAMAHVHSGLGGAMGLYIGVRKRRIL
jgi:uncharacterized membrane protein (Fun14 family)